MSQALATVHRFTESLHGIGCRSHKLSSAASVSRAALLTKSGTRWYSASVPVAKCANREIRAAAGGGNLSFTAPGGGCEDDGKKYLTPCFIAPAPIQRNPQVLRWLSSSLPLPL